MSSEVIINENTFALEGGEEGLKRAIVQTCARVHSNATANAPVDYGLLANSLMWRTPWDGDEGFNAANPTQESGVTDGGNVRKGNASTKAPSSVKLTIRPQGLEGIVGTNVGYAVYQEFGTRYQKAQPFMRQAGMAVRGATAAEIGKKYGLEAMKAEFEQRKKTQRKI